MTQYFRILRQKRNRPGTLDSAPPLIPCNALEKSRLCLLLRLMRPCFQILWCLFCADRWDRVPDDGFVLLQCITAGGANGKMLL